MKILTFLIGLVFVAVFLFLMFPMEVASIFYPPCAYEDARSCYWDGYNQGNMYGRSFIAFGDKIIFYVN